MFGFGTMHIKDKSDGLWGQVLKFTRLLQYCGGRFDCYFLEEELSFEKSEK